MSILLASSDRLTMQLLEITLSDLGVGIETSGSESDFARKSLSGLYPLIITDYDAPFLNGSDLSGQFRSRHMVRPVFFLLSYVRSEEPLVLLYESGVDQVIPMPFDATRLRKKVANHLKSIR